MKTTALLVTLALLVSPIAHADLKDKLKDLLRDQEDGLGSVS